MISRQRLRGSLGAVQHPALGIMTEDREATVEDVMCGAGAGLSGNVLLTSIMC